MGRCGAANGIWPGPAAVKDSAAAANHIDVAALSAHLHQLEHCAGTTGPDACP